MAQASATVGTATVHFTPLQMRSVMSVDVGHESGTVSKAKGPKYDIQIMPMEGGKTGATKWIAGKGKQYRENAIASRLCRIAIGAAGHEVI